MWVPLQAAVSAAALVVSAGHQRGRCARGDSTEIGEVMLTLLARYRVTLGFVVGVIAFALARPTWTSFIYGAAIAIPGELIRLWAAGHIDKGREITRSGPYRFVRHPLYLGSTIMAVGFAVASGSLTVVVLVTVYMVATLFAAMRTEEQALDQKFAGEYSAYREGRAAAVERPFTWARVVANREYRSAAGVVLGLSFLLALILWRQ
ncbi:MAG: isoprenylcysteine carboxylmethyltransferase family protein [Acidobacteria bacterium]|nr:MAG: isoprenylcysteine carboxylmethyltransferase family protein [Acidobacteriota bacterium]